MTQRIRPCQTNINSDLVIREPYNSAKVHRREKSMYSSVKPTTIATSVCPNKCKDRGTAIHSKANGNQLSRAKPNVKQQNMPSPIGTKQNRTPQNATDESQVFLEKAKTASPGPRSKSSVTTREPWGQLLKQQKTDSVFSNFDPLRTLHFLAKELQFQIKTVAPGDSNLQQIVNDIQYALKRVPPEVASTIHLQQAIDLLPGKRKTIDLPPKPNPVMKNQITQTNPRNNLSAEVQKVMEESTLKLELSCKNLETMCTKLRAEKQLLDQQLGKEKETVAQLQKRVADLEFEKECQNNKLRTVENEKTELEIKVINLKEKLETDTRSTRLESQAVITELKNSKSDLLEECEKLKHKLRFCAIEKEKFLAIIAVRDRQINEIKTEMSLIQDKVNDQLAELHHTAVTTMPRSSVPLWKIENNGDDVDDETISSIFKNEEELKKHAGFESGDNDA